MKTEIDFSLCHSTIKRNIKDLLSKGADPVELCMKKWEYIIDTGDTSPGRSPDTCPLCIKFRFEEYSFKACKKCPLFLSGNGCCESGSSYDKFSSSFFKRSKIRYAKEIYESLKDINHKKGGEKLSGRTYKTSAVVNELKGQLEESNRIIKNLRNRLIDHLNYTKFAILGAIYIPWISFTYFAFLSQIVNDNFGHLDHVNMVHDSLSGFAFLSGLIGVPILLFVAWYCVWLFWKEEYV